MPIMAITQTKFKPNVLPKYWYSCNQKNVYVYFNNILYGNILQLKYEVQR